MKFDKNGNPREFSARPSITFLWVIAYLGIIVGVLAVIVDLIQGDGEWPIGLYAIGSGIVLNIIANIASDVQEISYNLQYQNWKAARKEQMKRDLMETNDNED